MLGDTLDEGLTDAEGLTEELGLTELDTELEGLALDDGEIDGETLLD